MFENCLIFKSHSIAPSKAGRSVHVFNTTSQAQWRGDLTKIHQQWAWPFSKFSNFTFRARGVCVFDQQ